MDLLGLHVGGEGGWECSLCLSSLFWLTRGRLGKVKSPEGRKNEYYQESEGERVGALDSSASSEGPRLKNRSLLLELLPRRQGRGGGNDRLNIQTNMGGKIKQNARFYFTVWGGGGSRNEKYILLNRLHLYHNWGGEQGVLYQYCCGEGRLGEEGGGER